MKFFKRILATAIVCSMAFSNVVFATDKTVTHLQYTDEVTGKTIDYYDLGEDTCRNYVTQNSMFSDGHSMTVGTDADKKLYRLDFQNNTALQIFDDYQNIDSAVEVDPSTDTVYAKNNSSGYVYKQKLSDAVAAASGPGTPAFETLNLVIPYSQSDGDYADPNGTGLIFHYNSSSRYDRGVTYEKTRGGKQCRATLMTCREGTNYHGYLLCKTYI